MATQFFLPCLPPLVKIYDFTSIDVGKLLPDLYTNLILIAATLWAQMKIFATEMKCLYNIIAEITC